MHIAYVTHAFRQSADSSGLCPIQVACGLGIGSWCCVVEPMLIELVKTTTIMYYYYIVHNFIWICVLFSQGTAYVSYSHRDNHTSMCPILTGQSICVLFSPGTIICVLFFSARISPHFFDGICVPSSRLFATCVLFPGCVLFSKWNTYASAWAQIGHIWMWH